MAKQHYGIRRLTDGDYKIATTDKLWAVFDRRLPKEEPPNKYCRTRNEARDTARLLNRKLPLEKTIEKIVEQHTSK